MLVAEVAEALEAEAAAFARQEAGGQPTLPTGRVAEGRFRTSAYLVDTETIPAINLHRTSPSPLPCPTPHPPTHLPNAALSNQEALKERKLGALHQALAMYQQRLGLAFQHGEADGDQLHVVFTQVGGVGVAMLDVLRKQHGGCAGLLGCENQLSLRVPPLVGR